MNPKQVTVHCDNPDDRSQTDTPEIPAVIFTRFTFPGRAGKYSDFIWTHECFSGVDWNDATHRLGPVPHRRKDLAAGCGPGAGQL